MLHDRAAVRIGSSIGFSIGQTIGGLKGASVVPIGSWDASTSTLAQLAALVSHSRTSLATMFDSTGKLTYAPNNLLTQSNTFSNAVWTKQFTTVASGATDRLGGTSAWTVTATSANGQLYTGVSVSTAASTNFIPSLWIKRRTGTGNIKFYNPASTVATIIAVDNTWKQFYIPGLGTGTSAYITLLIETNGDAVDISEATLSAVTYETSPRTADQVITTSSAYYGPRIDYDPNTLAVKGLLIEEARTNLAIQSRSLANATWSKGSITVGSDSTLGVDGITADLLTTTNFIVEHLIYNVAPYTVVNGSTYTFTTFRKAGTGRYWQLGMQGTTGYVSGVFDLSLTADASAVQTSSAIQTLVSATSKYLGSGWHRLQVTFTVASGTAAYIIESAANANGSNTFSGYGSVTNGPANVTYYGSGSQAELGSFATSYIPTAAASVSRAADVVQGLIFSATTGSIIVEWDSAYTAGGGAAKAFAFSPLAAGKYLALSTDGQAAGWYAGGPGTVSVPAGASVVNRGGFSYNSSGKFSTVYNGGTVLTSNSSDYTGGATTLNFGAQTSSTQILNGHIKSFAIYNQRLADGTLQSRSVVGASY